ncbi:PXA domain-containing protein [Mucor mucedo]|uniref:PXA domain-containing protein n=1 Tax=Mucor mucedo TaxID=29922 RepID=UPI00221E48DB|nr:PXA domain-containing protein [Mucor mucedo]KAI7886398.1 PXA domain-containing protein [Mucor mucedo]
MTPFKKVVCIVIICFLSIQLKIGWNKSLFIWALTVPFASLMSLLLLNTIVSFIYLQYFVSPHGKRKNDSFKPLRFTHKTLWPRLEKQRMLDNTKRKQVISDNSEIQASFDTLQQFLLRDFIQSWFVKITGQISEQSFPFAVDVIIRSATVELTKRLQNTDLLLVVLNKIVPKITSHISEFHTAETSLRGKSLERSVTQSDELDLLLASRFRHGKLHGALTTAAVTTKPTEIAYLRQMIERVLPYIIEQKELQSGPVRVVIREIVSNSVLQPVIDMLADPDFWNQTIDAYVLTYIQSKSGNPFDPLPSQLFLLYRKMVRQLREVLNRHSTADIDTEEVMNVFNKSKSEPVNKRMKMGPKTQFSSAFLGTGVSTDDWDDEGDQHRSSKKKPYGFGLGRKTYQDFLKGIGEEKNLLDLKRVRNDIVTQIRKKKAQIADRDPEEVMDGEKVEDIIVYINRLSTAKKRVDKRISTLSGEQFDFRKSTSQLFGVGSRKQSTIPSSIGYTLRDILTNSSGLSYFMEFMDRRGDMVKLQFWLIVEGFHSTDVITPQEQETFLQDVKMVNDMYFTDTAPHRLHVLDQIYTDLLSAIDAAQEAKEGEAFSNSIRELGSRLYRIQQHVFWEIEKEHYPYFKRSDLYFKFLASAPSMIPEERRPASIQESIHFAPVKTESPTPSLHSSRPRGHQRALSDSTSKLTSFSNIFQWTNTEEIGTSSSVPNSIKSIDETEDEEEENEELPKRNRLVRSNTVDAVEAELRSILDGNNHEEIVDIPEPEPEPARAPKPTSSSSALLLCGAKGVKSTTAVPVENAFPLPSWTSSGGTNTISEIEHDTLDTAIPTKMSASPDTSSELANVHFAPPGDLMLAHKIEKLNEEVEKLIAQEAIVDALITKAEMQHKFEELRILKISKSMFRQEIQQINYQKCQYELQESENVLTPKRSQLNITDATIGSDKNGDFALYVIEIQQLGFDGNYASGWIVTRRYSEFFALHQKLKEIFPIVKLIEFPGKWPLLKLQKPFVETRRISLEKYLRRLIEDRDICQSQEFKSFLSQQNVYVPAPDTDWSFGLFTSAPPMPTSSSSSSLHSLTSPSIQNLQKSIAAAGGPMSNDEKQNKGFMRHIYKTVAAGIDDILIGPSMLDLITQRLGEQVMEFSHDQSGSPPASSSSSRSNTKLADSTTLSSATDLPDSLKAEGITRFTEPLCDLFIEMFELKDKTNWLRRQAVVIILQQILEGTIERKLREVLKYLGSTSMVVFYINKITDSLWPNGGPLTFKPARKVEEKVHTREEANRKLSTWLPDFPL